MQARSSWLSGTRPSNGGNPPTRPLLDKTVEIWRPGLAMQIKLMIAAGLLAASAYGGYVYLSRLPKLSEADAIVVGDFTNTTGEAVFDGSLREALGVSLAQSPYVNVVSSEKVSEALRGLGRAPDQPVTRELASGICQSTNAKAFVAGGISTAQGKYEISLQALGCARGT